MCIRLNVCILHCSLSRLFLCAVLQHFAGAFICVHIFACSLYLCEGYAYIFGACSSRDLYDSKAIIICRIRVVFLITRESRRNFTAFVSVVKKEKKKRNQRRGHVYFFWGETRFIYTYIIKIDASDDKRMFFNNNKKSYFM